MKEKPTYSEGVKLLFAMTKQWLIVTSSAIDIKLETKLAIYKNLENNLENFEFFVIGILTQY